MFHSGQTDEQTTQVASNYKAFGTSENMEFCQKSSFLERKIYPNRQVFFLGGAFKHVSFLHLFGEMIKT